MRNHRWLHLIILAVVLFGQLYSDQTTNKPATSDTDCCLTENVAPAALTECPANEAFLSVSLSKYSATLASSRLAFHQSNLGPSSLREASLPFCISAGFSGIQPHHSADNRDPPLV